MTGYHDSFVIVNKNTGCILVNEEGQFMIFDTPADAAKALSAAPKICVPDTAIRHYRVKLPWQVSRDN